MIRLVRALDLRVPASRSVVVRGSPDLEDQSLSIAKALSDGRFGPVTVLLQDRRSLGLPLASRLRSWGVRLLLRRSVRGHIAYFRARLRFQTQGGWPAVPGKVTVNVWHGMPVKKIGADAGRPLSLSDIMVATSAVFRPILASAAELHPDRVLVTGLPRNDTLLEAAESAWPAGQLLDGRPLALVLPTYRRQVGTAAEEGIDRPGVLNLSDGDVRELDAALEGVGIQCIVKPHPLAENGTQWVGSSVSVISGEDLADRGITLYELMSQAAVLVTDYSSAWIDFLLLDRPLVFTMSDLDEYRHSRGVYFEDLPSWVPGQVVEGVESLADALRASTQGRDEFAERRRRRLAELHAHRDSRSTERLLFALEPMVAQAAVERG